MTRSRMSVFVLAFAACLPPARSFGLPRETSSQSRTTSRSASSSPTPFRPADSSHWTHADLIRRMIDLNLLTTAPPPGESTGMFSSYDRASKLDNAGNYVQWDANADWGQFIRKTEDGWDVMAELDAPGVITRVWSANPHGRIRFVLDGSTVIDAPMEDLFNGKLPPFAEPLCYVNPHNGGKNCYLPIPFARTCRVDARDSKSYYQINFITFPRSTIVESFKPDLSPEARAALVEVAQTWQAGFSDAQLFARGKAPPNSAAPDGPDGTLKKGESFSIEESGPGTVRALYVAPTDRSAPRELYAFHRCVLRIYFDGEKSPSVETPLIDFFGSGFEPRDFESLVIGTARTTEMPVFQRAPSKFPEPRPEWYCYLPMPFDNGVRIEIENLSDRKIGLMARAYIDPAPPPRDALRLRARFRKIDPANVLDMTIVDAKGRGRIVGCLINVDCPRAVWWGEGDDKVWIDGEKFPSYFGTGSEDYLGDAWGLRPHIRPVQGATLVRPCGKQSAYRWHLLDCINFHKSVRFSIENWQFGGFKDTYYGLIGYWYGDPGERGKGQKLTLNDLTPPGLRIPGSFEIEGRVSGEKWGTELKQKSAGLDELSGGAAAAITTSDPVRISIPSEDEFLAALSLRVVPGRPFESIEVASTDGTSAVVRYSRDADGIYPIGELWLRKGENLLSVRCTKPAVLDCWIAEKIFVAHEHAIEAESLKVVAGHDCPHEIQNLDRSRWSRGAHWWFKPTRPGAWAELELSVPSAGKYNLAVVHTYSGDYGIVQLSLNGVNVGEPLDTFGDLKPGPIRDLGVVDLPAGPARLRLEVTGKNQNSHGYFFGVDCLVLTPMN